MFFLREIMRLNCPALRRSIIITSLSALCSTVAITSARTQTADFIPPSNASSSASKLDIKSDSAFPVPSDAGLDYGNGDPNGDVTEQKRILESAKKAVEARLKNVSATEEVYSREQKAAKSISPEAVARLVGIYENMPPREAASVFDVMETHILVAMAGAMNTRKLSAIMAHMSPDRVNIVSQYMIGVRSFNSHKSDPVLSTSMDQRSNLIHQMVRYSSSPSAEGEMSSPASPLLPSRQ